MAGAADAGGEPDDLALPRPAPLMDDHAHWMSPAEIGVSGFMPMEAADAQATTQAAALDETREQAARESGATAGQDEWKTGMRMTLPVGSWVELQSGDRWIRTQLTWASPHETLFLFTSGFGSTQSMTRRSRDKMLALGSMRLMSGQRMVEGALDAVAQTAMRNSLNMPLKPP